MAPNMSGFADEAGQGIETQIRAHKELGWSRIDLRLADGVWVIDADERAFDGICAAIDSSGLEVTSLASQICARARTVTSDFSVDVDELRRAIPRMKRLRTDKIRIMTCNNDKSSPWTDEAWKKEAIRRVRELAAIAEGHGIVLAIENAGGWADDQRNAIELLEEVRSESVALLFDMGNFKSRDDSWNGYQTLRGKIACVHLKDRSEKGAAFPGEGFIPVREIVADLLEAGYDGPLSIEPHIAATHSGGHASADVLYRTYLEAGRKAQTIVQEAARGVPAPAGTAGD